MIFRRSLIEKAKRKKNLERRIQNSTQLKHMLQGTQMPSMQQVDEKKIKLQQVKDK